MYLFHLHGNNFTASIFGVTGVLFRQTNILWVVFVAGLSVEQRIIDFIQPDKKDIAPETVQSFNFLKVVIMQLFSQMKTSLRGIINLAWNIVSDVWCYILIGLGFAYFIKWNGGIVVGDKSAHVACLHFPQFLYFTAFTAAFAFPHLLSIHKIVDFLKFLWKRPLTVILFCTLSYFAVDLFTYEHPYLLADNRHYTFYIWSKIFRRHHLIRYMLIPCYLFAAWSINSLINTKTILWKIVFWLIVIVASVPQMLMEFRYFIIPYLIWRMNIPLSSYKKLTLECIIFVFVNALTLYLYIKKPFQWVHDPDEKQRFMW